MGLDFVKIKEIRTKKGNTILEPEFIVKKSKDLMIQGKSFYAIWDEEAGLWRDDERDVQRLVDKEVYHYMEENRIDKRFTSLNLLQNFSSNKWTEWQRFCKSLPDNFHTLDVKILFSNDEVRKEDYATRILPYPIQKGDLSAYDRLMSVLYDEENRQKLEWAVGSVIKGDSATLQKFIVLYGGAGTGKSTFLNIVQQMFPGYVSLFESKALGSNNDFALESLKENKPIAIQHDGDLSGIEDNSRLNSVVSHEEMVMNEKHKSKYRIRFRSFLFMGTNKPVRITDAKSGLMRRLIDVFPTGNKVNYYEYIILTEQIGYELGAIADHCLKVYESLGKHYYDSYKPSLMMDETNEFYNFIITNYELFNSIDDDGLPLRVFWLRYKEYCDDSMVKYPMSMRVFKNELKNYFKDYKERYNGKTSVYFGFLKDKFEYGEEKEEPKKEEFETWLKFNKTASDFDDIFKDCPAQYANEKETPTTSWDRCKQKLGDLDTRKLHYVLPPDNLICFDFDLKNENGEKDFQKNLEAASRFPPTYAELSKGGAGIHLCYYYTGDISALKRVYAPEIEIKVFQGKSSLRRRLSKCNDLPIATITSGLPLKEKGKNMLQKEIVQNEEKLRELIKRNLKKEYHPGTKPSIDFIYKILNDAYEQGLHYDVTDLRPAVQNFAMNSTHQADYCMRLVSKMKFRSEEPSTNVELYPDDIPIVFYDVEVFPNLFLVSWKFRGKENKVKTLINPTPEEIEALLKYRLIGYNNRRYDNHVIYARRMGYTEEQLFDLSQRIINGDRDAFFGEAYNLSYTDVYDFLSAGNKKSLKKWEIELGIHHQELGFKWDEPVPKNKWKLVADYCGNDVIATEAVFDANQPDWTARQILADVAGMTVNDTTNSLTTKIIVGDDRNPQSQYIYTNLAEEFPGYEFNQYGIDPARYNPEAKIVNGKSIYMGEDPGEGGRVFAKPGMYYKVGVLDVASMHPHSIIRLKLFGEYYTMRFADIVRVRLLIKHKQYEEAKLLLDGKLAKYLNDPSKAKQLANGLKTAINSVYGLTSAKFPNKLRDPRNIDNIVAKRGALFMIKLQKEVEAMGYNVVHIKTDSIKIANITPEIVDWVMKFGEKYGYTFEYETLYSKMCLVNDAVYIAEVCEENGEKVKPYWTATGTQFQVPYVFKTLFSKEKIEFSDLCETKSVTSALYLDYNEKLPEGEHDYRFVGKVGAFTPVLPGYGGGILLREKDGKYYAATGTKKKDGKDVYRWYESEAVKNLGIEAIDRSYYDNLVDEAIETIEKYGDFERFVNAQVGDDMSWMDVPVEDEDGVPFDELPFPMNPPESEQAA